MKKLIFIFIVLFSFVQSNTALAQVDSLKKRFKVAVFTPLYLDSVFNTRGEYKKGKELPKYINAGLDFYEGIQMAVDSLKMENVSLEVHIIDTRSATKTLQDQLNTPEIQNAGLFIGHVTPVEAKQLAGLALQKNIPFINANFPNDAGITGNPSLVILNTTLKTHCEGIYRFLQKNYSTSRITILRKEGAMEDRIKGYFTEIEKNTASVKLNVKFVTLNESNPYNLKQYLDSTRTNVSLVGSFDEKFGKTIAQQLATLSKTYPSLLIGMPTWDTINDFTKSEYKGLEIIFTTPFYNARTDKASTSINTTYKNIFYLRPSDMVMRGYECMYRFGKLLADKGTSLSTSIGEKKYKLFTDFDIQPVLNKQTMTLDYFENKKIYLVKKLNGLVVHVF